MTALARPRRGGLPNHVLGLYLVIAAELMFFAGLVSALVVARANLTVWIPADQPRLPIPRTAFNTALLLLSGLTMRAARQAARRAPADSRGWLAATAALGAMFVALQGVEWAHLLGYGITAQSSLASGFFYLIVGAHAAHVLVGLTVLLWLLARPRSLAWVEGGALYWTFVVLLWPPLYVLVFLA